VGFVGVGVVGAVAVGVGEAGVGGGRHHRHPSAAIRPIINKTKPMTMMIRTGRRDEAEGDID
jgi:hypothetical protein